MQHVILGAGPAGVIAAETIRKHAPNDGITVVGDEPEPPYSRMAIPYMLIGNVKEDGTHLRHDPQHFARLGITVLRQRAKGVDAAGRKVTLADGRVLPFDKLLVATGSQPVRPPIPGMDLPNIHPCWTLEDARHIERLAKPGARVLQMGAGFIGCIIMEALAARGVQLTVVEMGDRMVPRMMGPTAGGMIKRWCEAKGVRVFTGAKVESIVDAGGGAMRVALSTGQTIDADLVISATGVKPNVAFLQGSGIECGKGVLANERLETNVPGVFAAGDCAEAYDLATKQRVISAIQPNAADQAAVAALNMLGRGAVLKRVPQINVLDTLGLISTSFGDWEGVPGGERVELTDAAQFRHLSLQFDAERLVGCNSIGWTDHVGVMRGLVEGRVRLGEWRDKLKADPTKLTEAYIAQAQAQSQWAQTGPRAK